MSTAKAAVAETYCCYPCMVSCKLAMVRACHTPQQSLRNHSSGHLGGWAMSWAAEGMLDQKMNIPAHARAAHKGLLQKRLGKEICWIVPHFPSTTHSVKGLNWTELIVVITIFVVAVITFVVIKMFTVIVIGAVVAVTITIIIINIIITIMVRLRKCGSV